MHKTLDRLWQQQLARLQTRRGVATTVCAVLVAIVSIYSAASGAEGSLVGVALAIIVLFPAIWWLMWFLVVRATGRRARLVAGQPPQVQVGRAWQPSSSTRRQPRRDANARFFTDRGGILFLRRSWFIASGTPPLRVDPSVHAHLADRQQDDPQRIGAYADRTYWWHQHAFYWTNVDYKAADVKALLFAQERQHQREIEHAHALLAAFESPLKRKRDPIPMTSSTPSGSEMKVSASSAAVTSTCSTTTSFPSPWAAGTPWITCSCSAVDAISGRGPALTAADAHLDNGSRLNSPDNGALRKPLALNSPVRDREPRRQPQSESSLSHPRE